MKVRLGASVSRGAVTFGVWAPFADAVSVVGNFNDWQAGTHPLTKDEAGVWSAKVIGAKPGQEYKYAITKDGHTFMKTDPRALQLTPGGDNGVIVADNFDWQGDDFKLPPPSQLVIYELHVGTFNRPDASTPGTFDTVAAKLDYLADLGVNAIELLPVTTMWEDRGWGYAPTHFYSVEAAYGGRRGLMELVLAAHRRGIGVILDVVYNHLGPGAGDLWQFDGWSQDGKGGIYFYNDWRAATPWGDRLDYGRLEVRQFLSDNIKMWLTDYHVDGLRIDSTHNVRNAKGLDNDPGADIPEGWQVLQDTTFTARQTNPLAIVIAEDSTGNATITKPVADGGAGFTAEWQTSFPYQLRDVLEVPNDADRNLEMLTKALEPLAADPFRWVIFSDSHDADANGRQRLSEELDPGHADSVLARQRSALAAALCLTLPGIPMLFQGQEFMAPGAFNDWQALDWARAEQEEGMLQLYSHLAALRLNRYGNSGGLTGPGLNILQSDNQSKVLAYHRWTNEQDDTVVVVNFANTTQTDYRLALPRPGHWQVRLNSAWQGYCKDFSGTPTGDIVTDSNEGSLTIGPYAVVILSLIA